MIDSIFSKQYRIGIAMVDTKKQLSLSAIETLFMECASLHCEKMGLGIIETEKQKLTWVITKMRIEIIQRPMVWQTINVRTWPLEQSKIAFDRDFEIVDQNDKVLVKATSRWCLIDINSRKPVLQESLNFVYPQFIGKRNFTPQFLTIKNIKTKVKTIRYSPRYSDLDFNGHINNAKYFDIVLDIIKKDQYEKLDIGGVQVNFISEAKYDDKLLIEFSKFNNGLSFTGKKNTDELVFEFNLYLNKN